MQKKKLQNQRMLIQKITEFSLLQNQVVDLNKQIKAISSRCGVVFFFLAVFLFEGVVVSFGFMAFLKKRPPCWVST